MFPATACTFRSSHLVAEENAPNRIRPTCVQARPSCRPCRTKRELLFPRKTFSWRLSFSINPRISLVASGSAISRFGFVNKRAAWCGMLALVIAWLLSACASSPQEGVVTENANRSTRDDIHRSPLLTSVICSRRRRERALRTRGSEFGRPSLRLIAAPVTPSLAAGCIGDVPHIGLRQ